MRVFGDALASEWTKLRSVRSTYWTVAVAILLALGLGAAISAGNASHYNDMSFSDRLRFDPTAFSTAGLFFAQLSLGVLAILALSSEYTTGTIRTTIAAVPQRGYTLAAKALLITGVCLGLAVGLAFAAFFLCKPIFSHYGLAGPMSFSHHGVLRAVLGSGLYIGVLALFALGLAAIIRHTAGTITTLVAVVFIVPIVSNLLPHSWQMNFSRYLPANAGSAITNVIQPDNSLGPWTGFFVFVGWAVASIAVGWYLLRSRDV